MSSNKKLKQTNIKDKNNQISATQFEVSHYEGILPPIEVIEAYEKFQIGSANRILTMIENQVNSRVENEKKLVDTTTYTAKAEVSYNFLGLVVISLIIIMILIFGFILAFYKDRYELLATSVVVGIVKGLVDMFNKTNK